MLQKSTRLEIRARVVLGLLTAGELGSPWGECECPEIPPVTHVTATVLSNPDPLSPLEQSR